MRSLSLFSSDDLLAITNLTPGSVTPLGILNDIEYCVNFYLDSEFMGNRISVHPNDNTTTVRLMADDLKNLIKAHGNSAEYAEI